MAANAFEQTPLFQLNLMIWLSWPSHLANPIFHANGFVLHRLAQPIRPPVAARMRAAAVTPPLTLADPPSADLLLCHHGRAAMIQIECKVSAFSPAATQAKQARALLVCDGPHIAGEIGLPTPTSWRAHTLYAVRHPQEVTMADTLGALARTLRAAGIVTTPDPPTSLGIDVVADGVYLTFAAPAAMPFAVGPRERVMDLEPSQDPYPLYVVPLDPDIDLRDLYGRRVLEERLRVALVGSIGRQLSRGAVSITWDDLMREAIPVWQIWNAVSRRTLVRQFRPHVQATLRELNRLGARYEESPGGFAIPELKPDVASRIRRYLLSPAYGRGEIRLEQAAQLTIDEQPPEDGA